MAEKNDYSASSIRSLTPIQHLRKRMSLTFGPVEAGGESFSSQKAVALRELLDNSVDEVRSGHGTSVNISFFKDRSFEVSDAGRGIPIDSGKMADGTPASGIHLSLGVIQSGGKFETNSKSYSAGLNGVGASSTVAVSLRADVTVYRNKKKYRLSFKDGIPGFFSADNGPEDKFTPITDLTELRIEKDNRSADMKKSAPTGTTVKVWLDDSAFSSPHPYNDQDIIERLRGTAFLVPELHVEVYNELNLLEDPATGKLEPQHEKFHFPDGTAALLELIQEDNKLHEPIHINTEGKFLEKNVPVLQKDGSVKSETVERSVPIELIFGYGDKYETRIESFVNTIRTKLGGVHHVAFERALLSAFNERFTTMRGLIAKADEPPTVDDFLEGLTAVLSVQVSEPTFTSQSKEALSGREVQKAIQETVVDSLKAWIADKKNAAALDLIAKKVTTASKNRQKAREQRDLNRKKNEISQASLPVKLLDCELSGTEEAELYICEGDSALGSLKQARDGSINALLPIRGKIINAHKTAPKKVLDNAEVQDIIKSLGAGSGKDFNIDQMRYGRIFIAADADADGLAIAVLIYTLFWNLFKPVVEQGRLYKLETPLFVISTNEGRKSRKLYAQDETNRDSITAKLEKTGVKYSVTRLKGLGEVKAEDLYQTAISPETRIVTQITMTDIEATAKALEIVAGTDTGPRKEWIESSDVDEKLLDD